MKKEKELQKEERLKIFCRRKGDSIVTKILKRFLIYYLYKTNREIISFAHPHKIEGFKIIKEIMSERRFLLRFYESYQLYIIVKSICEKRKGALAEVGVYMGGSAKVMCEAKKDNLLYLFDTFEGLPEPQKIDGGAYNKGDYNASYENVKNYLKGYKNIKIYKGLFPQSADEEVKCQKFIFVHLDVDIYKSTLDCLKFFYPRMEKGAILISHDYLDKGVKKAFDEFFKDKPELIIELMGFQCMFIKK